MEIFLNISLVLLGIALIIVFFKSPWEIIKNFFNAIFHQLRILTIPFEIGHIIVKIFKPDKSEHKLEKSSKNKEIQLTNNQCFLFIYSNYSSKEIENDINKYLKINDDTKKISHTILKSDALTTFELSKVDHLSQCAQLLELITPEYGSNNCYIYIKTSDQRLFLCYDIYEGITIGKTDKNIKFSLTIDSFKTNSLILIDDSLKFKRGLNTEFFESKLPPQTVNT